MGLNGLFGNLLGDLLSEQLDPDVLLQNGMAAYIERAAHNYAMARDVERWTPDKPLRLLLAGYVGTRNTGADVRVEEMIRQFRAVLGDHNLELAIVSNNLKLSAGYFRTVRQLKLPDIFPPFLYEQCPRHHGVVACEGSMFKSKFANALSIMMAGALGMANAERKLSVGYGAEAGAMTRPLERFVEKYCGDSLVICRNEPSREVLHRLGVRTDSGTDTAWTFAPAPAERGEALLRAAGWDGTTPVLAICPINPFWWPVKPDLVKSAAHRFLGEFAGEHYRSIYFHEWDAEKQRAYDTYLGAIAASVRRYREERAFFPILVGMEQLDRGACERLAPLLDLDAPLFVSDEHDMFDLVSVLRRASAMVSSRYHAIVTSMPGLVPSGGITMDERIRNLMHDRGQPELYLEVDEEGLEEKLYTMLRVLFEERERVTDGIARNVPAQLRLMGQMGMAFEDEVCRVYPEFPRIERPREWSGFLPPLSPSLSSLLERHG
jgi:polysaccharide pyruvyl transferase WcaK-like protein